MVEKNGESTPRTCVPTYGLVDLEEEHKKLETAPPDLGLVLLLLFGKTHRERGKVCACFVASLLELPRALLSKKPPRPREMGWVWKRRMIARTESNIKFVAIAARNESFL